MATNDEQPSITDMIRAITPALEQLKETQAALLASLDRCRTELTFATHPELLDLDGELDNCFPEAWE